MKKFLFALLSVVALLAASCSKGFDDSEIWDKINSLEERVAALEQLCKQRNTNITSLQTIVDALQKNDYVTNVAPIKEDGDVVGYTITFAKGDSITIYLSGNASTPQIGVKKHSDGIYYWTLGGEWLLDGEGNKVKAQGNTPKLKIENEYWYVSYDNGATWSEVGKATSDDGDSMFTDVTYDEDYVYLTLSDGTALVLPRFSMPSNEIWYTSTDGNVITPYSSNVFGANIVSNVYEDGKGIITFDGDVTEIGYDAFVYCEALESITLPARITSIGEYAFYGCYALTSITMPEGVQSIGEYAFYDCFPLESITIPNSVTEIGRYAFSYCSSLESITIPNSVTEIGGYAFWNCSSLESITIPNSVTEIGYKAFYNCSSLMAFYGKYASVDNCCLIVDGELVAFARAGLTSYTIPNGVTSIGEDVFYGCDALTSITLPDSVTEIGILAFQYCTSLESITLPDSVTEIGDWAFHGCSSLATVYSKPTTPPTLGSDVFKNASLSDIYVPTSSVSAYKSASGWSSYASMIEGYNF